MRGQFIIYPGTPKELIIPNIIVDEGEIAFLKMIGRADVTDVSAGGNFFAGLCAETPDDADTLSDITTEPTVTFGYARKAISRDGTGWPVLGAVGDANRLQSLTMTWTAAGGNFSRTFQRLFLCNVSSGSAGLLFAYSGLLPNPIQVDDTKSFVAKYELYMR